MSNITNVLYENTKSIYENSNDSKLRSDQAIIIEEFGSILGLREATLRTKGLQILIGFFKELGLEYGSMYIVSKECTIIDTVYTIGYLDKPNTFQVFIEGLNGNEEFIQAGILMNFVK